MQCAASEDSDLNLHRIGGVIFVQEMPEIERCQELLTSYVPEPGGPARFYERLGFAPTGDVDEDGEVIMRLALP